MKGIIASQIGIFVMIGRLTLAPVAEGAEGYVRISEDRRGFAVGGVPWYPFGCNYFDPYVGWPPKLWQRFDAEKVESHFRVMRGLGVKVVRVFLTAQSFFPEPPDLQKDGLEKFDRMLAIARRYGIRVHPTGPDHWEGNPVWRRTDFIADPQALESQAAFWRAFARRYRDEPAIFAYDILNEPHVRWNSPAMRAQWPNWLREDYTTLDSLRKAWGDEGKSVQSFDQIEIPADAAASGSRALLDYQRFREWVAERWLRVQVAAIRAEDPNHLVTVGLIQWSVPVLCGKPSQYAAFRPDRIAPMLDFLSIHFYPLYGSDPTLSQESFGRNLAYLELVLRYVKAGAPGKPLLIQEFGWHGGDKPNVPDERSPRDQASWCREAVLQGRGIAAGWLNWAYADTPTARDLTKFSGLVTEDGRTKPWGITFRELATNSSLWYGPPDKPRAEAGFDVKQAVCDPQAADAMLQRYYEAWKVDRRCALHLR